MASGWMMLRLGLAALVSGAAAGMLLPLAFYLGALLFGGWTSDWEAFAMLIGWLEFGFVAGLIVATLPAFVAGASMWALGTHLDSALRPLPWAAAGAVVAAILWTLSISIFRLAGSGGFTGLDFVEMSLLAAGLPAGAGGALVFRTAIRLSRCRDDPAERRRP